MFRLFLLPTLLIAGGFHAMAQKFRIHDHKEQIWIQYFNLIRLSEKTSLWFDAGLRTDDEYVKDVSTALARIGVVQQVTSSLRVAGGYAFFNQYPVGGSDAKQQGEHRLWQQAYWLLRSGRMQVSHQVRFEQRWRQHPFPLRDLGRDFYFHYRLRYNFGLQVPLSSKAGKGLSWVLNDEIMANFGRSVVYNNFDQNRIQTGFRHYFNPSNSLFISYMNTVFKLPEPNEFRIMNVIRVSYFHNLDLRSAGN